jgi:hypothetical protein
MALETLATNPSALARQVMSFLQEASQGYGDFALAILVPSETGLCDRWNLVLSAPWIDRNGLGATIPTLTSSLVRYLSKPNAHKLERISVLPTTDPLVIKMAALRFPLGEVHQLQDFSQAEGAIVFRAGAPIEATSYHSRPVSTRA